MYKSINYLILNTDGFLVDDKLQLFNKEGHFSLYGVISQIEDLFIHCQKTNIDVIFIFDNDNLDSDILQDLICVVKKSFPSMCICVFSDRDFSYRYVDYQFTKERSNLHIYSILHRVKHPFAEGDAVGFFVSPQKIIELFDVIEIHKNYKGYGYLVEAIELVCRKRKEYFGNMTKLYKDIAEKYGVTYSSIERCIRLVLTESSIDFDIKKIVNTKYSPLINAIEKVGNATFIKAVANFLATESYA